MYGWIYIRIIYIVLDFFYLEFRKFFSLFELNVLASFY